MKVIILHGLGQNPASWNAFIKQLDCDSVVLDLFAELSSDTQLSIETLHSYLSNTLKKIDEPFILLGLSLGGFLALRYAVSSPSTNLKGLIICSSIYKSIPPYIQAIQNLALFVQPSQFFKKIRLSKKQMLELIHSINTINLTTDLKELNLPSLVVCGSLDTFNLRSSRDIHQLIPQSELVIITGGYHELNVKKVKELSELTSDFMKHRI